MQEVYCIEAKENTMKVDKIPIYPLDLKENGLCKIDLSQIPLPDEFSEYQQIMIYLPPLTTGGNHRHPRRELFFSLNEELQLHWIDEKGILQIWPMKEKDQLYLFDVHPFVPHAIVNTSPQTGAVLLEITNEKQYGVEAYPVISNRLQSQQSSDS